MNTLSASTRAWAVRLLALEAANQSTSDAQGYEAVRVWEKLRVSLTRFAGADSFALLLQRALALAQADVPSLDRLKVTADGRLDGREEFAAQGGGQGAVEITAYLLGLLVTFIGAPLTLRLIRDAWPDVSLGE